MIKKLLILLLISLISSFGRAGAQEIQVKQPYDSTITATQALNIAETTFRYQFGHNESGQQQKAPAYFLSLFGKDPTPEFLDRFKNNKPPVQKGSQFAIGKGLKFRVDSIKRVSGTKVEVIGGYEEAGLSASLNSYFVELRNDKWIVTGDKILMIK
jgi:hypothetical protein